MKQIPLVSISCITYNHGSYIRECLDGFLMQETTFPFEILIHDDASTDDTASIIREYEQKYPDNIKPIYQTENQYSKRVSISATFNWPRAQGKYIALCEGDDYWTDPLKLQKQVDFLEENGEYSLTCHRYSIIKENSEEVLPDYGHALFNDSIAGLEIDMEMYFKHWLTKTMTVVFRKEMLDFKVFERYKYMRDVHLFFHLIKEGNGYCFNQNMAVYRMHSGGVHSSNSELTNRLKISANIYKELYQYNSNITILKEQIEKVKNWYYNHLLTFNYRNLFFIFDRVFYANLLDYVKIFDDKKGGWVLILLNIKQLIARIVKKVFRFKSE